MLETAKNYYALVKPGMIYGNAIPYTAGFALAAGAAIDYRMFVIALLGLSLVIASGCVFNNYMDRDIDLLMERTKRREIAAGRVSLRSVVVYGTVLGICGFLILGLRVNVLALAAAFAGFVFYVALYGPLKRRTVYGTLIGSIAGAAPPLVGYAAAGNRLDAGAAILFAMLMLWQMPHFYAIAIRRLKDYAAAGIPVLPAVRGVKAAKKQIFAYIVAFTATSFLPTVFGYTGRAYLAVAAVLGFAWLGLCIKGFSAESDTLWAREMFLFSLLVLMALCLAMAADVVW